jgi:hypothetical protein
MFVAQFNISKERQPIDHPSMQDFVEALAPVNEMADNAEGFVWRLHDDSGNATAIRTFDDPSIIFNLSVWKTVESLKAFAYRSGHAEVLKRRREWFETIPEASYALWWVEEDERPSLAEAKTRLRHLREHGASQYAFTFDRVAEMGRSHG